MASNDVAITRTISNLSDDELIKMINAPSESYTAFALEVARKEIEKRGGVEAVKENISVRQQQEANLKEKKRKEERVFQGKKDKRERRTQLIAVGFFSLFIVYIIYHEINIFIVRPNAFRAAVIQPLYEGTTSDEILTKIDAFYTVNRKSTAELDIDVCKLMIDQLADSLTRNAASWIDVTAKRSDAETLFRAVALKYHVQPDLVRNLVNKSIPGSEQFILSILNDEDPVGTAGAALVMLNSGNNALEDGAKLWAKTRGHEITTLRVPHSAPRNPQWH